MGERDVIDGSVRPATRASLVADLRALGVTPGMTMMVHVALSRIGYVAGGAHAVVLALLESVGDTGTLVMPAHSTDLTDPADWSNPPVPVEWQATIRDGMPPYDPVMTPPREMGAVVDCFRHVPGVIRSGHPTVSAAAVGPNAAFVAADHELRDGLGERSPQGRLYELDGHVLLMGVTHANNTSLHLAERRSAPADARWRPQSSPLLVDGERRWVTYECLDDDPSDFENIGEAFAESGAERSGPVGAGVGRLMRCRDLVDFATDWMNEHRTWPRS
ncbi:aminoglycoside N(3)-acetyltransferase [Ilumatobacter sp.]|uniref:aminoglycoside N(3)-acetyltransferase n=1 Tax=Ilumatobacter sp. TaxID=1967498 RepID=UPI003AF55C60